MKKFLLSVVLFSAVIATASAQDRWGNGNGGNGGYYMGPGMMWGGNGGYYMGPGMMDGYWMDHDWHRHARSSLNLSKQQESQWDNVAQQGRSNQKAVNDSINYYVQQIQRLQKAKSDMVQQDLQQIKQVLTPEQYTQFLEKLVAGESGK